LNFNLRLSLAITFLAAALIACSNDSTNSTNNSGANITPQNISAEYGIPGNLSVLTAWANENNELI